jgi:hypothetical protein
MNKYALLVLTFISQSAIAADADLLRCRGIGDPAVRLACYDSLANAVASPPPSGASAKPEAPAARASAQTPPVAVAPVEKPASAFGFEDRAVRNTTDKIESRIVGFFAGWSPNARIRLENGQVWQVSDDTARDIDLNNPKVWVRRGALGAFYLEIEGKNHSPRVKRVE